MLIFDENEPERAVGNIEGWIKAFAEALPGDIRIDPDEGRGERYAFRLTSRDDLNNALAEKASEVPLSVVPSILHRFFRDRFSDSAFSIDTPDVRRDWMDCRIRWLRDVSARAPYLVRRSIWRRSNSTARHFYRLGSPDRP